MHRKLILCPFLRSPFTILFVRPPSPAAPLYVRQALTVVHSPPSLLPFDSLPQLHKIRRKRLLGPLFLPYLTVLPLHLSFSSSPPPMINTHASTFCLRDKGRACGIFDNARPAHLRVERPCSGAFLLTRAEDLAATPRRRPLRYKTRLCPNMQYSRGK